MNDWKWLLFLGITMRLIISKDNCQKAYSLFFRWPVFYNMVLVWRMSILQSWPRVPYVSLKPLRTIPDNAAIIKACKENDIALIRKLLSNSQAHVNDVTSENLTPLRVCLTPSLIITALITLQFAIRGGHYNVVKLLLESGADPNQTFGTRETSPLNNAFLTGRPDIIRLLLSAKADLNYINTRTWTNLYYIWDPEFPNHATTTEILDICATLQFDGWQFSDMVGWTPFHRAASFGKAAHIKKLFNLGVIDRHTMPLTVCNWCPIMCAARFSNLSTFQYLTEDIPNPILRQLRDKRGWSLLHLAAESGSEEMLVFLMNLGLDLTARSDPTALMVPEELDYKYLTPRTIAVHYGHEVAFDNALRSANLSDQQKKVLEANDEELIDLT